LGTLYPGAPWDLPVLTYIVLSIIVRTVYGITTSMYSVTALPSKTHTAANTDATYSNV